MPKAITLAGATGRFRALAPSWLEHGHRVRALGHELAFERIDNSTLPPGLARPFDWLDREGDHVDIAALHTRHPEVGWLSFQAWAEQQDWRQLVPAARLAS